MTDTIQSPAPGDVIQATTHTFRFEQFQVRGATHVETEFTIDHAGNWTSTSTISTRKIRFKPSVSLYVEFFLESDDPFPVPVGAPPADWYPKEIWQADFRKNEEKTVKSQGQHHYLAENFQRLANEAQAKLKMKVKKRPGLLKRLSQS